MLNVKLTVISLMTLPLFGLMYVRLVPQLEERYRHRRDLHGQLTSRISEVLNGLRIVRVFNADHHEKNLFQPHFHNYFAL